MMLAVGDRLLLLCKLWVKTRDPDSKHHPFVLHTKRQHTSMQGWSLLTHAVEYARKFSPVSRITLLILLANTPDVSLKLDQNAKNQIFKKGDCRAGGKKKTGESSVSTYSWLKWKGNSWNGRSGPGESRCSPAAFVIMNITEGERERKGWWGEKECKRGVCGKYQQLLCRQWKCKKELNREGKRRGS